jgi:tetratricopeptide (TPR) repeat protein
MRRKLKGLTTAAVVLLFAASPIVSAQTANGDINLNRLSEAASAIGENRLPRAEELLNAVLAASPNDADALNLLGVVRAKQNRTADAERYFRRALASLPSHVSAHINFAELLLSNKKPKEALPLLLQAHKLAPERADINLKLATVFADQNNYEQASQYLRLVPRDAFSDASPETQAEFALLLARNGFNEDALNMLQAARQNAPASFPLLYALGVVTAALKQYDKADEHLTAALTIKPDDVATLRALARVARANGNLEKALSHLVAARRVAPNSAAVLYDFGVTALRMELVLDALPVFERLHREYPREPAYLYALAAAHWTKGDAVETTRLMKQYTALQPRDPAGLYLLGAALLRQDQIPTAQSALQRSFDLKADPDTEYLLGVCFEKAGNRTAALNTYRRVVQSRPNHAAAHAALGTAYREAGSYAEARAELEQAVQLDPDDLRANYQLGLVYAKLGDKAAAQKRFDHADELRKRVRDQERVILKLIDAPQP